MQGRRRGTHAGEQLGYVERRITREEAPAPTGKSKSATPGRKGEKGMSRKVGNTNSSSYGVSGGASPQGRNYAF